MKLRVGSFGSFKEKKHYVREMFRLWKRADMDPVRFRQAVVIDENGVRTDAFGYDLPMR